MAWTDERLDDLARHIDARFDAVDRRFAEVDARFAQVDRRFDQVHSDIRDLYALLLRLGGGVMVGLVGVIAAVLGTA